MTDETGAFVLKHMPCGVVTVKVAGLGWVPVLTRLTLRAGVIEDRTFGVGGGLQAIGRWPPTLDPDLDTHMHSAKNVRVFRLDGRFHPNAPLDPERYVGPWAILFERHHPSRKAVFQLALRAENVSQRLGVQGDFPPVRRNRAQPAEVAPSATHALTAHVTNAQRDASQTRQT